VSNQNQMALSVQLPDDETFLSYQGNANPVAVDTLKSFITANNRNAIDEKSIIGFYLFGLSGVGKSHLLHASCGYAAEHGLTSVCLSLGEVEQYGVAVFDGLEFINLVCLDDIQVIAHSALWQQAVFDLYNRISEQGNKIIITGDKTVKQLNLSLADLASRLSWGYAEQLKVLSDEDKLLALQFRASQRGLTLNTDVASFLISRLSRDMKSLLAALDKLDKASIREQRKITIPFIKEVLF